MLWIDVLIAMGAVLVLGTGLIVGMLLWFGKRKKYLARRKQLNGEARRTAAEKGLTIDKVFTVNDHQTFDKTEAEIKPQFLIDSAAKKMVLVDYDKPLTVVADFSEFLNYEIYENGSMAFSGGAMGGLLVGGFWGETVGKCNNLRLIIRLKRYDCPQVAYEIIAKTPMNMGVVKTSRAYQTCVSSMQELASFFEVIANEQKEKE